MTMMTNLGRVAVAATACMWLAACTQTGSSSYNGSLGARSSVASTSDKAEARQAERKAAARKRAADAKAESRAAFLKQRESDRAARTSTSKSTKTAKSADTGAARVKVTVRNGSTAKSAIEKAAGKAASKSANKVAKEQSPAPTQASYAAGAGGSAGAKIAKNGNAWGCVPGELKAVLGQVSRRFGRITVNSTHRSPKRNRNVGGRKSSMHLDCKAVDFRVHGNTKGLLSFLKNHDLVGGYKRYPAGYYHIDTGPKRTW